MIKTAYEVSPASYTYKNAGKTWMSSALETFDLKTSSDPSALSELSRHAILVLPTFVQNDEGVQVTSPAT